MYEKKVKCLLLALGAAALMGCGGEEAVHTSAEVLEAEAELSEDGGAADVEEETPAEEAEEGDPSDAGGGVEPVSETGFMAPVEMDETLKNELAEELLQENEMDTSVVESAPVTKGCSFTLPEAFSESEDIEGMYVTRRYPIDASTIYYVALGRDVALQLMTEETFKAQAEENFRKEYGEEIEVTIDSFESIRIDGCPAFRILCHYQVGDTQISQLEYAINADKSYVITYSQTSDYDRMEEYEASAETIHLEF
ncbi:MAG: hypothetical protein K2I53_05945 [Lachnospiraceae bacterium]|nr:hypothetical protein [Lachnospiraceae bacterium]